MEFSSSSHLFSSPFMNSLSTLSRDSLGRNLQQYRGYPNSIIPSKAIWSIGSGNCMSYTATRFVLLRMSWATQLVRHIGGLWTCLCRQKGHRERCSILRSVVQRSPRHYSGCRTRSLSLSPQLLTCLLRKSASGTAVPYMSIRGHVS